LIQLGTGGNVWHLSGNNYRLGQLIYYPNNDQWRFYYFKQTMKGLAVYFGLVVTAWHE
jgi:hypothetical protein